MGIKFHCPQGHKLNVKAFLAGKKGVCPKCGTRVRIPTASEPGLGDADDDEEAGGSAAALPGNGSAKAAGGAAIATAAPAMPAAVMPAAPVPAPTLPMPAPRAPAMPAQPAPLPTTSVGDPIAEAPGAIWYVRPPSGGQFGPARGDVMRKWIAEGRVSSDSLVWREGWSDWQNAGKLFPNLQAANTPALAIAPAASGVTRAASSVSRYQSKKGSSGGLSAGLLIFLAIVCVALVAVLAYVLFTMNA